MSSSFLSPEKILAGAQDNQTHYYNGSGWTAVTCCDGLDCSFDKTNENIAYATTQNGLLSRSNDGGLSFSSSITPPTLDPTWECPHLINPLNSATIYISGSAVHASNNRGDTWFDLSPKLDSIYKITSIAQSPADTGIFYAASFRKIYITTNYGLSWLDITAGLPADSAAISDVKTDDADPLTVYVTFSGFLEGRKVFKTTDGGLNWTNISGTLPNVPFNTIVVQKNSQGDLYAGCDFGVFYFDVNNGDWVPFSTDLPGIVIADLDINYRNGKLFAATHGRGIYTTDLVKPIPPILNDAAVSEIIAPFDGDYCDSLTTPFIIKIKNYGVDTLTSITVNYSIDNGPVVSIIINDTLATNTTAIDSITFLTFYGGAHSIHVFTSDPNGATDDYTFNDAQDISFKINTAIVAYPFAEGFENPSFPPADWFKTPDGLWLENDTIGAYGNSTHSAKAKFYDIVSGTAFLTTMRIDLSNATPITSLGFAHA